MIGSLQCIGKKLNISKYIVAIEAPHVSLNFTKINMVSAKYYIVAIKAPHEFCASHSTQYYHYSSVNTKDNCSYIHGF